MQSCVDMTFCSYHALLPFSLFSGTAIKRRWTSTSLLAGSRHWAQNHESISWTLPRVEQGVLCPLHLKTCARLMNAQPSLLLQDLLPCSWLNQTHPLCAQVFIGLCKIAVSCCWCQPTSLCAPLPAALTQKMIWICFLRGRSAVLWSRKC